MECIMEEYLKFTNNFFTDYFKLLLDKQYDKKIVTPFIEKYIKVRYYNNGLFNNEKNFVEKINKELHSIANALLKDDTLLEDPIKNTYALFTYILYLDDCYEYNNINTLIKTLFEDKNIKLTYTDEIKNSFKQLVNKYVTQKKEFIDSFNNKDFQIEETKVDKNTYEAELTYNFEINKLYSEYAIETAYNSEVVSENRLYLLILLLSKEILQSIIKMDYSKKYIVELPESILQKPKKQKRFLRALDNDILKSKISLRITYQEYIQNTETINNLISSGHSMSLVLDSTFKNETGCLVLFDNVYVYKKDSYYDTIMNNRDKIDTNIILV